VGEAARRQAAKIMRGQGGEDQAKKKKEVIAR
jgi:hypothetical protein